MNRALHPLLTGLTLAIASAVATAESAAPPHPPGSRQDHASRPARHDPSHRRFAPLSSREVETALEVLQRVDPKTAQALQQRYEQDPQAVGQMIQKRFPRMRSFLAMQRWDPMGFDLRVEDMRLTQQTRSLVRVYRQAITDHDDPLAQQTHQALTDNLAQRYDLRQQTQQHELDRLEERMDQIRQKLLTDQAQRDQHIQDRLHQLLAPPEPPAPPAPETSPLPSTQPRQSANDLPGHAPQTGASPKPPGRSDR